MKPCTMELGGHSPVIVCEDADVDNAADLMASSKFRNAGQVCISPTRFYVHERAYDRFVSRFLDKVSNLKVGPGLEPETSMGPLAHKRRVPAIAEFVADADARGATVLAGGHSMGERGNFFAPTVIDEPPDDSRLMTQEPFGPIAAIKRFTSLDDAIERANAPPPRRADFPTGPGSARGSPRRDASRCARSRRGCPSCTRRIALP
jgi:succinate-semialdehyde dehydrogenase/glutarate-semialdehyde dehydrogenase